MESNKASLRDFKKILKCVIRQYEFMEEATGKLMSVDGFNEEVDIVMQKILI